MERNYVDYDELERIIKKTNVYILKTDQIRNKLIKLFDEFSLYYETENTSKIISYNDEITNNIKKIKLNYQNDMKIIEKTIEINRDVERRITSKFNETHNEFDKK